MSYIAFITESGKEVEIRGPERAHMSITINKIFESLVPDEPEWIAQIVDPDVMGHLITRNNYYQALLKQQSYPDANMAKRGILDCFRLYLRAGFDAKLRTCFKDNPIYGGELPKETQFTSAFELQLNTAKLLGSDPLKLFAKLHGQCEIHCYVEEKNREWLAGIIRDGLRMRLYRPDMNWENLIALLDDVKGAPGPVVSYYSVSDYFPPSIDEDGDGEPVYDWKLSMKDLRAVGDLEISPEKLGELFGSGKSIFDICKAEPVKKV